MRKPHRCNNCRGRFTLRRERRNYLILPRCPHCGSRNYHFDTYEYKARLNAKACNCSAWWFPHRYGSGECARTPGEGRDELIRRFAS